MTDFSKILNKAKELENMMKDSQEKIKKIRAEGVAGGDAVKITLNGDGEIINLDISAQIFKEDKNIVEDLIKAAHNNAKSQLKTKTQKKYPGWRVSVLGFKWPI